MSTPTTTLELNLQTVRSTIESELRLANLPMNETFGTLGLQSTQLERVRGAMHRVFGKSLLPSVSETIYSYTDRLQRI